MFDLDSHVEYNGVLFMPPADQAYVLEIIGLFHSNELVNNTDTSFWTERYPEILLIAALYQLEVSYRNTEGAKDWLGALTIEASSLGKDFVEEHIAEINQMEG